MTTSVLWASVKLFISLAGPSNPVQLVKKSYLKRAASAAALRGPPAAVGFPPSLWPLFTPPTSMGVSSSSSSAYLAPLSEWPLDLVQSSASAS